MALRILIDLVSMRRLHAELAEAVDAEEARFSAREADRESVRLPNVGDLRARCEVYFQKANHVVDNLEKIARVFYGDDLGKKHWMDSLERLSKTKHGENHPLTDFISSEVFVFHLVNHVRNAIEHDKPDNRLIVTDFFMDPSGDVVRPTLELVHGKTPCPRNDAVLAVAKIGEALVDRVELFMAMLCAANIAPSPFPVRLLEVPEGQRQHGVKYDYFAEFEGRLAHFADAE